MLVRKNPFLLSLLYSAERCRELPLSAIFLTALATSVSAASGRNPKVDLHSCDVLKGEAGNALYQFLKELRPKVIASDP
jgi:hypothetical protein